MLFAKQKWSILVCVISVLMQPCVAEAKRQNSVKIATSSIERQVRVAFAGSPVMVKIAKCESEFRQFDEDGNPLKNDHSSATGIFQFIYSIHGKKALRLGFDLRTTKGNIGYAKHVYRNERTTPWNESKHCWG